MPRNPRFACEGDWSNFVFVLKSDGAGFTVRDVLLSALSNYCNGPARLCKLPMAGMEFREAKISSVSCCVDGWRTLRVTS